MTIQNFQDHPRIWSDAELEADAQQALEEFVVRRLAEPGGKYFDHIAARRKAIFRLFKALADVNPVNPNPDRVRAVLLDAEMFDALRYVAGPPISEDDLGVLVTRDVEGLSRSDIKYRDEIPAAVLQLVCKLADPFRFPWIASGRKPTNRELRNAVASTMTMHAAQALQTERRGYGKIVERRLETRLVELGFRKIAGGKKAKKGTNYPPVSTLPLYPRKGIVSQPSHHPTYPHFYGECVVYSRKVDLFIALPSGKMIALEAKDSSSGLNSKKRLLNDTAAKAIRYATEAGKNVISVALLSGVFKISDLKAAQEAGLFLVWAHEMDGFIDWVRVQSG